jgi:hypothetical protein
MDFYFIDVFCNDKDFDLCDFYEEKKNYLIKYIYKHENIDKSNSKIVVFCSYEAEKQGLEKVIKGENVMFLTDDMVTDLEALDHQILLHFSIPYAFNYPDINKFHERISKFSRNMTNIFLIPDANSKYHMDILKIIESFDSYSNSISTFSRLGLLDFDDNRIRMNFRKKLMDFGLSRDKLEPSESQSDNPFVT